MPNYQVCLREGQAIRFRCRLKGEPDATVRVAFETRGEPEPVRRVARRP